jgi:hypothetical protein
LYPVFNSENQTSKERKREKKERRKMEELMPKLVEMVLGQVNHLGLVACHFMCIAWMCTIPP